MNYYQSTVSETNVDGEGKLTWVIYIYNYVLVI